jgi:hypothetical protein
MILPFLFEDLKEGQTEQLEDFFGVRCEGYDLHSDRAKKIHRINGEVTRPIVHQYHEVLLFNPISAQILPR